MSRSSPCAAGCGVRVSHAGRRCIECYRKERVACKKLRMPLLFPCAGGCGQMQRKDGRYCRDCNKIKQDARAAYAANRLRLSKLRKSLDSGKIAGLLWVAPDEAWTLNYRCDQCKKPILIGSNCYVHATGKDRTVLRPEERTEQVIQTVPMYVREAVDRAMNRTFAA